MVFSDVKRKHANVLKLKDTNASKVVVINFEINETCLPIGGDSGRLNENRTIEQCSFGNGSVVFSDEESLKVANASKVVVINIEIHETCLSIGGDSGRLIENRTMEQCSFENGSVVFSDKEEI